MMDNTSFTKKLIFLTTHGATFYNHTLQSLVDWYMAEQADADGEYNGNNVEMPYGWTVQYTEDLADVAIELAEREIANEPLTPQQKELLNMDMRKDLLTRRRISKRVHELKKDK